MAGKKKPAPGEIGHNSGVPTPLTDDELHALTLQHKKKYESALAKKKAADADLKNVCKVLKSDLGDSGLKDIKDMIASEEDGFDERFQAELERNARLARWLGLDIGAQADLFSDFGGAKPGVAERAFEDGKRAGLAGEECKPPFNGGSEGHQKYVEGWHKGQADLAGLIKKTEVKEVPLIVGEEQQDNGVDELDAAAESGDQDEDDRWPDDDQIEQREEAETL